MDASTEWDPAALEAKLSRLPPARPCESCPSRDRAGELHMIAPQLGRVLVEGREADAALFVCPYCGARWSEPLS